MEIYLPHLYQNALILLHSKPEYSVSDGIWNTDYTGLKWSNINQFWHRYGKYNFIADVCNHSQMVND